MTAPDQQSPPPTTNGSPREGASPAGAAASGPEGEPLAGSRCLELCPICRTAEVLRAAGPVPELRGQLDDVGREALLTLRSLIDHYLDRLDAAPTGPDRVEEIPID